MKRNGSPWNAAALAAALAALAAGAWALGGIKRDLGRAGLQLAEADAVAALAAEARALRAQAGRLENLSEQAGPADLRELSNAYLPETSAKVTPRPPRAAGLPGWQLQEAEIQWTAVEWDRLAKFLARAESEPLPWRVVEFTVEPVGAQAGSGRAVMQRLESGGAEPNEAP